MLVVQVGDMIRLLELANGVFVQSSQAPIVGAVALTSKNTTGIFQWTSLMDSTLATLTFATLDTIAWVALTVASDFREIRSPDDDKTVLDVVEKVKVGANHKYRSLN